MPHRIARIAFLAFPVLWFAVLLWGVSTTRPPVVFGDELGYFLPMIFGTSTGNYQRWNVALEYPAYLYFWLGSLLPLSNLHFWIKALNVACISAASIPAYFFAKRYVSTNYAALFACFVILTPIATFARYVMPEPVYFFGFWCCLYVLSATLDRSIYVSALATGASIGALSLIKPHAIAVAVGIAVWFGLREWRMRGPIAAVLVFAAFYVCHACLTLALLGHPVWSLSGGAYSGVVGAHIDWNAAFFNAIGHALALVALYGPLVGAVLICLYRRPTDKVAELGILSVCLIATMIAMTVHFSQGVYRSGLDSEQNITRLHGRYYVYALPLLVLLGAALRSLPDVPVVQRTLLLLSALAPLCTFLVIRFYDEGGFIDNPGLFLWTKELSVDLIAVQVAIFAYCCLARTSRRILAIAIAFVVCASIATTFEISIMRAVREPAPSGIDAAFLTTHGEIGNLVGRSDGVVLGSGTELTRALFYLRSLSIGQTTPPGPISDGDLPAAGWVLLLPGIEYRGGKPSISENGLTLVRD